MSATTVTPLNRETIYERVMNEFIKGGNDFLLKEEFELGKGWSKHEMHFQYLYLNLLCNFSCDISYILNEKIKELLGYNGDCKIPYETQVSNLSRQYTEWKECGNIGDFVQFLLSQINLNPEVVWEETGW